MSQIFDSLRRGRETPPRPPSPQTAQGDAVLATLGYTPPRPSRRYGTAAAIAAIAVAIGVLGWLAWRAYFDDRIGSAPPRPVSPLTTAHRVLVPTPNARGDQARESKGEVDRGPSTTSPIAQQSRGASAFESSSSRSGSRPAAIEPDSKAIKRASDRGLPTPDPGSRTPDPGSPTPDPGSIAPPSDLSIALYFHRAGEFENALRYYRIVLERDELNAQAHNNLGLLYQERRLLQDSARELKRALAIEPRNSGTHNNYGVTLLLLGRIDEAGAEFQTALSLEPGNLDALVNLGLAQRDAGQLDTAKETLLRALNLTPDSAAAHYNLAQLYDQTNEPARAVEHYRRFLEHAGVEHADRNAAVRARITALSRIPE